MTTLAGLPLANAFVRVRADTTTVRGEVGQGFSHAFDGLKSHFGGLGKAAGLAVAGGVGVGLVGLGAVLHTGFGEFQDYQAGLSQLNAGLKSTGGVAGLTSTQMEDLASKIQGYSGQTDDSIVKTESLLLTFTNIRDAAGKNNDIFTQSTKIAADMAARMGGDASGAAIQLGKALNDPVKGITALTRVGVSFSEEQKKTIKSMVEHNNTLGAQKVILGELNKEFGGSAAAFGKTLPGQIAIAKRSFEDFSQGIVTAIIPVAIPAMKALGDGARALAPIVEKAMKAATGGVRDFIHGFTIGTDSPDDPQNRFARFGAVLYQTWTGTIRPAFQAVAGFVREQVIPAFKAFDAFITGEIVPVVGNMAAAFTPLAQQALHAVSAVVTGVLLPAFRHLAEFLAHDVGPAIVAVTHWMREHKTLVQATVVVVGTFAGILGTVTLATKLWAVGTALATAATNALRGAVFILNLVMRANPIGLVVTALAALALGLVYAYKHSETFRDVVNGVFHAVEKVAGKVVQVVVTYFRIMAEVWLTVAGAILHGAAAAFGWVPGIGGKLKGAVSAFDGMKSAILGTLGSIADAAGSWGQSVGNHFAAGITYATPAVKAAAHELGMTVDRYLKQASPAKAGPLSLGGGTHGWGADAADLYAKGIRSKLAQIRSAAADMGAAVGTPAFAGAAGAAGPYAAAGAGSRTFSPTYQLTVSARDTVNVRDEFHRMELLSGARYAD